MKFSAAAVLAAVAGAQAYSNVTYTTEVVTAVTTYCPGPTEIVHGDKTYTITEVRRFTTRDGESGWSGGLSLLEDNGWPPEPGPPRHEHYHSITRRTTRFDYSTSSQLKTRMLLT